MKDAFSTEESTDVFVSRSVSYGKLYNFVRAAYRKKGSLNSANIGYEFDREANSIGFV